MLERKESIPPIALGAWSWGAGTAGGDQVFGYYLSEEDLKVVFDKAMECGLTLWDTAAVYEFLSTVEEAKQDEGIDEQENMLIRSAFEFTEQEAVDILTPRIDITAVSTEATKEEIAAVWCV